MSRHHCPEEHESRDDPHEDLRGASGENEDRRNVVTSHRGVDEARPEPWATDLDQGETSGAERSYYLRDRVYVLRESAFATLVEIGKFRVINLDDLASFAYKGDADRLARDIRRLEQHGLLLRRTLGHEPKTAHRLVTLTKKGKRLLLESGRIPEGQALYHGIVKPRELKHDAVLYRLYQKEASRLTQAGGRVRRVVLDYELKRRVNRDIAMERESSQGGANRKEIAERNGLSFVGGKIQMPDLRLEYQTAEHQRAQIDLELATRNYRPRALAEKAKAGFSLYAHREDATRLRRILDESELTARIFAL